MIDVQIRKPLFTVEFLLVDVGDVCQQSQPGYKTKIWQMLIKRKIVAVANSAVVNGHATKQYYLYNLLLL